MEICLKEQIYILMNFSGETKTILLLWNIGTYFKYSHMGHKYLPYLTYYINLKIVS